jgi:diguanylate cyclase (GGDEF)-like protein/PAS domain S-box-containing protein
MITLPFALINWLSAILLVILGVYCLQARRAPAAIAMGSMLFMSAIWAAGDGLAFASATLDEKIFWTSARYPAVEILPLVWLWLTLKHSRTTLPFKPIYLSFLLIVPLILIGLRWTSSFHTLYQSDAQIDIAGIIPVLQFSNGGWYYIHLGYAYTLMLIGMGVLVFSIRGASSHYRQQTFLVLAGAIIPCLISFVTQADIFNLRIRSYDPSPLSFLISGPVFVMALFRYRMLDLVPVARSLVVDQIEMLVLVTDLENRLIDFNRAAARGLNLSQKNSMGKPLNEVLSCWENQAERFLWIENTHDEIYIPEERQFFELTVSPIQTKKGETIGRVVVLHDITERKLAEEKLRETHADLQAYVQKIEMLQADLREQAIRDSVTGLYNRRFLEETLERLLRQASDRGHPVGLIFLDIDHFKLFNDTSGHAAGDLMLRTLAQQMLLLTRSTDLVCRYGGEEFVVVLPDAPLAAAVDRAEKIRQAVARRQIEFEEKTLSMTISVGVAAFPEHGLTSEEIIAAADMALYRAKAAGRNQTQAAQSLS